MSAVQPNYQNEETRDEILDALDEQEERRQEESLSSSASPVELTDAEGELADEPQPGGDLPQPETKTIAWRGTGLEWEELGDTLVTAAQLHEEGDLSDAQMMEYIWEVLAEKSVNPDADVAYWKRFDLHRDDDVDGLMDLFDRLVGESDGVTEEAQAKAEEFREERRGDRET